MWSKGISRYSADILAHLRLSLMQCTRYGHYRMSGSAFFKVQPRSYVEETAEAGLFRYSMHF